MNDAEDVQLLSLVLMYALDLDIEECFGIDANARRVHDVLRQADFVGILDLLPLLLEIFIIKEMFKLVQFGQVGEVLIAAQLRRDQFREPGIGLVEPSSGGDAVGHVGELVGSINLDKVFENCCLD